LDTAKKNNKSVPVGALVMLQPQESQAQEFAFQRENVTDITIPNVKEERKNLK